MLGVWSVALRVSLLELMGFAVPVRPPLPPSAQPTLLDMLQRVVPPPLLPICSQPCLLQDGAA
jgi:hypothetical protein